MIVKGFSQTSLTNWTCCWTGATVLEINTKLFQQNFLKKQPRKRTHNSNSPRLCGVKLQRISLWDPKEKKVFGSKGKLRLTEKKVRDEFN